MRSGWYARASSRSTRCWPPARRRDAGGASRGCRHLGLLAPRGALISVPPPWRKSLHSAESGTRPRGAARSGSSSRRRTIPVSQEQRDELLRRSPENVIHLTLGEERPGDGPAQNRYTRAAEYFRRWLAEGVLRRDPTPALYPLEQSFWTSDGRQLRRRGFMAAVRLHEFREGVIVPHEKTLVAPKADRLEILKHVGANLSPIFGLYRDEAQVTARTLDAATAAEPIAETDSDDGVHHRMWRTEDPALVSALTDLVARQRIFIADGHHRYETALVYQRQLDEASPGLPADGGHHYILMFLCPMNDPGLFLFPTHRLVFGLKDLPLSRFLEGLARYFTVETLPEDIRRPAGRAWAISKLAEHGGKASTFLLVSAEDQKARVVTLRDDADPLRRRAARERDAARARRDGAPLHRVPAPARPLAAGAGEPGEPYLRP